MNNSIHINDEIEHFGRIMDNRGKSPIVHSKDEWDARAFHWAVQMEDRCYEERVQATVDYFLKRGVLKPEYDLIDVGCGPGRRGGTLCSICHAAHRHWTRRSDRENSCIFRFQKERSRRDCAGKRTYIWLDTMGCEPPGRCLAS